MTSLHDKTIYYPQISEEQLRGVKLSTAQQETLDLINQKVASGLRLNEVMNFVFEQIVSVSECDRLGLAFVEEEGKRVTARWARALYKPVVLKVGYSEDLAGSSLEEVINKGRPRVINDLEKYLEEHPNSVSTKLVLKEGVRSSMTCPLSVEGRQVGLFFRSSRQKNAYDEQAVIMHVLMAERLSQAVEKAWMIENLERAKDSYLEMLGFASHELKNPLSSMLTDAYMLGEGYFGQLNDDQKDKIKRITSKIEYITNMVREYLDLSRLEGGTLRANIRSVDFVRDVLDTAVDIILPQMEEKKVRFEKNVNDGTINVECDPDLMKIVMVNLLGNGVKYGNENGQLRLDVNVVDDRLNVSVLNEGPGFSDSAKQKLFKKFSRLDEPELKKRKGTGVGLYTCWRIVVLHGGRIWAESEQGKWARFSFVIPAKGGRGNGDKQ